MTINYTTLLGLAKPVTGTETGQWGDIVNDEITSLLEDSIAKAVTLSVTSANVTLTTTNGATNQARVATLIITGTPGITRNIIAPSQSKIYQVINQSDSSVVIKGAATTGVTILAGASGVVAWNGSDFIEIGAIASNRTINGVLQLSAGTASTPSLTTTGDTNTGLYFPAADTVAIATGGVKRVEVDANGNVGVGITPSAWGTYNKVLQVRNAALSNNDTIDAILSLSNNCYRDNASGWKYNNSGYAATLYQQGFTDSGHYWFTAPSGTAGNPITFTQAMTLDASGNLGVGATAPTSYAGYKSVTVEGTTGGVLVLRNTGNTGNFEAAANATETYLKNVLNTPLTFGTNNTERARITIDGNLLVGTTTATDPNIKMEVVNSGITGCYLANNPTSAETNHTLFAGKAIGVDRFWVLGNGNVANQNNSYGGISDAKLKENIVDTAPKLDSLLKVRIVNYNLKTDPKFKQIGVIAQELEQIFPSMIEEMPDRDDEGNDLGTVTKSVKYSAFVPMLIKAIQEQQALIESQKTAIESLTARITALEAK